MLASPSPSHRVEGLERAGLLEADQGERERQVPGARREAALLLGFLERLGEPYGPPEVGSVWLIVVYCWCAVLSLDNVTSRFSVG